jgi:D-isomer specific 2-hydroxyacid dehydrogenase, NAD binding domain
MHAGFYPLYDGEQMKVVLIASVAAATLALLKDLPVNVARGEPIDEPALVAALASGHLAGFAAGVYGGELVSWERGY